MIYLASPYSHPDAAVRQMRYEIARSVTVWAVHRGHIIFSPIVYGHDLAKQGETPGDWRFWQHFDEEMIALAAQVWILTIDGWQESVGVTAERELARKLGKEIKLIGIVRGSKIKMPEISARWAESVVLPSLP